MLFAMPTWHVSRAVPRRPRVVAGHQPGMLRPVQPQLHERKMPDESQTRAATLLLAMSHADLRQQLHSSPRKRKLEFYWHGLLHPVHPRLHGRKMPGRAALEEQQQHGTANSTQHARQQIQSRVKCIFRRGNWRNIHIVFFNVTFINPSFLI